ncbi:MAG: hypothetical protein R2861_11020 [Desulfobacterales bacterium]
MPSISVPGLCGIYFSADKNVLYRINYTSRLISRVLAPLVTFPCPDTEILYETARQIRWTDFTADRTFAVFSNVANSAITHSKYAALRVSKTQWRRAGLIKPDCGRMCRSPHPTSH